MYSKISTAIIAILTAASLCASEFSEAQAKVKSKYPKEFAEIQKLAETDMDAARKKLYELANKGKIKLPGTAESGRGGRSYGRRSGQFGGRGGQFGGRGQFGGMRMGQFSLLRRYTAEKQIAQKFPAEYAAADKEFLAAVAKIEALAAKAKVTLPISMELQIRKLRAKAPEEFEQLEELAQSDPRAVFGKLRELSEKHNIPLWETRERSNQEHQRPATPPPTRKSPQQIMRELSRKYPEEMKKIMALREENPREFAKKIQELHQRSSRENASGAKK
jgi:hypothetical protein